MMDLKLKHDLYRASGKTGFSALWHRLYKDPCFRFIFFLRKASTLSKINPLGFLAHYFYKRYTFKYGIQIPKTVQIGKGFVMLHQGGIVVNSKSVIGDNCTLMHNVTLGNTKRGKLIGAPVIGNNVYIGPGAVIVGRIIIGDNVLVAPNSYVNTDVPSDSIVIGNPGKIIPAVNATEGYINNILKP